jgi:hypothetical protein
MEIRDFKANLSAKLLVYIKFVEDETGRQTRFEYVNDFGHPGVQFAFRKDPTHLVVAAKSGILLDDPRVERAIAHEITHALLIYGLGYYALDVNERSTDEDISYLNLLSFIDDIAVNKVIQAHDFMPFGPPYREMLNKEILTVRHRVDFYGELPYGTLLKRRYIASRHVLAWSAIRYYDLDADDRNLLSEYLKVFQRAYPMPYLTAKDVEELIVKNDVFSADGHKKVIDTLLRDWNIKSRCIFRCCKT